MARTIYPACRLSTAGGDFVNIGHVCALDAMGFDATLAYFNAGIGASRIACRSTPFADFLARGEKLLAVAWSPGERPLEATSVHTAFRSSSRYPKHRNVPWVRVRNMPREKIGRAPGRWERTTHA
ncbi:hypothetical protein [Paraburkholderia adhaesiva]|uniref:hypothetical protein n=1 Tax=Paraburkholderia adhaesiva TaxID=2883244 RepID=UPI001F24252E|nr:hypothetical protein [Paraburkholderia adhaesiva]